MPEQTADWTFELSDETSPHEVLPSPLRQSLSQLPVRPLRDFLIDVGHEFGDVSHEQVWPPAPSDSLNLAVIRNRWHIRLGSPTRAEVEEVLALAAIIYGGTGDWKKASSAGLKALLSRWSKLRAELGESSVVEAVALMRSGTSASVAGLLASRSCPRSAAGCRYLGPQATCSIDEADAAQILENLVKREILRSQQGVGGPEYSMVP